MIQNTGISAYIRLRGQLAVPFQTTGKMVTLHLQYWENLINDCSIKKPNNRHMQHKSLGETYNVYDRTTVLKTRYRRQLSRRSEGTLNIPYLQMVAKKMKEPEEGLLYTIATKSYTHTASRCKSMKQYIRLNWRQ